MRPEAKPLAIDGMTRIPAGTYTMGSDEHYPEEAPAHRVKVDGFWIDTTAVTNAQFARFVAATGHATLAERPAAPTEYPGAPPELLAPSSIVFVRTRGPVDLRDARQWWRYVRGADWRHPDGPGSSIEGLDDHPVVHVAYEDALAYAAWSGKSLPTEAEWEYAARGGLDGAEFAWGDELAPGGVAMANYWQGEFPWQNLVEDGYEGTAPVRSYAPNGYGLYEMTGNTWEWTSDFYQPHAAPARACCAIENPRGGSADASRDPDELRARFPRRVTKGGSFLCAANYCRRYRPAARMAQPIDTSTCHLGFRCVVRDARAGA